MNLYVLDISVIVKLFSQEIDSDKAELILHKIQNNSIKVILPELVKYELGNVLVKGKPIALTEIQQILDAFYSIPFLFFSEDKILAKLTTKIAKEQNITYYDASFVSLARQLNAILITSNPKHQKIKNTVDITSLNELNSDF